MRTTTVLMITAVFLLGCQGSRDAPVFQAAPATFGQTLPSPAELDAIIPPDTKHQAAKSTSRLARITGNLFEDTLPLNGTVADPALPWSVMAGDTSEVSFCIFRIDSGVFGEGQFITALLPHFEWAGTPPAGAGEGIWVGFSDYSSNSWKWYGPFSAGDGWADTAGDSLEGRNGNNYIVVVNYSNTEIQLDAMNYQFTHFSQVFGDEWIYYKHHDPENPTFGDSISKIKPDGTEKTLVLPGAVGVGNSHPRVVNIGGGDPMLVFLEENAPNFNIKKQALDQLTPADLLLSSTDPLEPGGWNREGTIFLWTEEDAIGNRVLYANNTAVPETGLVSDGRDYSDIAYDNTWFGDTYRVICSMNVDLPTPHQKLVIIRNPGPLPVNDTPTDALLNSGETDIQPAVFSLLNGLGSATYGFFFASKGRDDTSFNLYIHMGSVGSLDAPVIPLVVDPTLDFTSPIPATDGTQIAFIATNSAENYGTLYVMDMMAGSFETATAIAENVAGQVFWYDPTP